MNQDQCYYAKNDMKDEICGLHKEPLMEPELRPIPPGGRYPEEADILICPVSGQKVHRPR